MCDVSSSVTVMFPLPNLSLQFTSARPRVKHVHHHRRSSYYGVPHPKKASRELAVRYRLVTHLHECFRKHLPTQNGENDDVCSASLNFVSSPGLQIKQLTSHLLVFAYTSTLSFILTPLETERYDSSVPSKKRALHRPFSSKNMFIRWHWLKVEV